jgi:DNA-binding transcriptional ArsR family regulator
MSESDSESLSQGVIYDILSSPRRRFVLYYLREQGGQATVSELADEVAAWENDRSVAELSDKQRKRAYVSLYQTHVPKLAEVGIIDYDKDSGLVRLTDRATRVNRYLATDEPDGFQWELHYLGLAIVSTVFLVIVAITGALSATVAGGLIVLAFAVSAIAHVLYRRYLEPGAETQILRRD